MSSQGWSDALNSAFSLFTALPEAAREQAADALRDIGQEALELQEALVPKRTGFLGQGLTVAEAVNYLRVRVGFPSLKGGRNDRFYAIVMEYGRKAQTVTVRRSTIASPKTATARKRLRAGQTLRKPYLLSVTALPARPFVHVEDRIDQLADRLTEKFWDQALARAGGPS
jgi:hypothetical protein